MTKRNSMLFSALILLISLIAFSCHSPANTEQSYNLEDRLSGNLEMAEETIVADEIVTESNIITKKPEIDEKIVEANEKNAIDDLNVITEKPEPVEVIAEAGKQDTVTEDDSPAVIPQNYYTIQIGAYRNINYANEIQEKLKAMNLYAHIEREDNFSKVRIAGIRTKEEVAFIIDEISYKFKLKPVLLKNVMIK